MQESLPLTGEATDQEIIANCKTFKDALRFSWERSGKSLKVLAIELQERGHNIDPSVLSLHLSANPPQKKNFDPDMTLDFVDLTTDIPLRWLSLARGYGLVRLKSSVEMENEELKAKVAELTREREVIIEFVKKVKGVE